MVILELLYPVPMHLPADEFSVRSLRHHLDTCACDAFCFWGFLPHSIGGKTTLVMVEHYGPPLCLSYDLLINEITVINVSDY